MKFAFGVASIVIGYALLYQGAYMARMYEPDTGGFRVGPPPLAVLLGFVKVDTKSTDPAPVAQAPFTWGG